MANGLTESILKTAQGVSPTLQQFFLEKGRRRLRQEELERQQKEAFKQARRAFLTRQFENLSPEVQTSALEEFGFKPQTRRPPEDELIRERLLLGRPEEREMQAEELRRRAEVRNVNEILEALGLGAAQKRQLIESGGVEIPGIKPSPLIEPQVEATRALTAQRTAGAGLAGERLTTERELRPLEKEKLQLQKQELQTKIDKLEADIAKIKNPKQTARKLNEEIDNLKDMIRLDREMLNLQRTPLSPQERINIQQNMLKNRQKLATLKQSESILNGTTKANSLKKIALWVRQGLILPREFDHVVEINNLTKKALEKQAGLRK